MNNTEQSVQNVQTTDQVVTPVAENPVVANNATTQPTLAENAQVQQQPQIKLHDLLAEDFKQHKALANFNDVNDLAKSLIHAQSLIGKRIKDMSPEDLADYKSVIGVPDAHDKYQLALEANTEMGSWYKQLAFEAGLSQDQAKKMSDAYLVMERERAQMMQKEAEIQAVNNINQLKEEFGTAFDKQIEIAKRAVVSFGGEELKQVLNETGLGNDPRIVKMFANIGKQLLEDTVIAADHESTFGITPKDAENMIQQKMLDPEFQRAYRSAVHPGHKAAVEEMTRLYSLMSPNKNSNG